MRTRIEIANRCLNILHLQNPDMHLERVSRNGNGLDSPSLAVVAGDEITSNALTLAESVDVVWVRNIKDDFGVDPGCWSQARVSLYLFANLERGWNGNLL